MKAKIINSNYEVDVQSYYQEGWFMGFTETSNPGLVIYRPQDLEFPDERQVESKPDWSTFRREAAKDILCALVADGQIPVNADSVTHCIELADELIRQLKEKKV